MNTQNAQPIRSLHIDIEGGWGGSSRSLFELVSRFDRARVMPMVAVAKRGPAIDRYAAIGIPTVVVDGIQSFVPRKKALIELAVRLPQLVKSQAGARAMKKLADQNRIDVVHLNYEGLFALGRQFRALSRIPIVTHLRASRVSTGPLGRLVGRCISQISDHVFCISPVEMNWFEKMVPANGPPREVLWNIAGNMQQRRVLSVPPRIVYLGNIDHSKGVDRLLDIAASLDAIGAPEAVIEIYGEARNDFAYATTLNSEIVRRGLQARVQLMGYIADPHQVLAGAFVLVRPSRWDDPWGRDVIEAAAAGCPVLATGTYDGVVKPGVTGFLFSPFDAQAMADKIVHLFRNPIAHGEMISASQAEGQRRFSGEEQANRVMQVFETLTSRAATESRRGSSALFH